MPLGILASLIDSDGISAHFFELIEFTYTFPHSDRYCYYKKSFSYKGNLVS